MRLGFSLLLAVVFTMGSAVEAAPGKPNLLFLTKERRARALEESSLLGAAARKKLFYFGGRVLGSPKIYAVMWGSNVNADTQSRIGDMLSATLKSSYLDMLNQYSTILNGADGSPGTNQTISRGSFGGTIKIQPANTSADLQDADVGAELERQIESGSLPKPDGDSAYFLYFPPGISITMEGAASCKVFCGYHHWVNTRNFGQVYFSVQPDLGGACSVGCGVADSDFDNISLVTSHELSEIVTDPGVDPHAATLAPPIAWMTTKGAEIGDLCASEVTSLSTESGANFLLQQAFDNSIGMCNKGPFRSP